MTDGLDTADLHDFLLTYRSFTTAFGLMDGLIERYNTVDKDRKGVKLRVFNVLQSWAKNYWYDFSKDCPELADKARAFLQSVNDDTHLANAAKSAKEKIDKMVQGAAQKIIQNETAHPDPLLPKNISDFTVFDVPPKELSRQITLIEWKLWKGIQPWECLGLAWTKKDKLNLAPNVLALINRFNYVSGWVATSICMTEDPRARERVIKFWIKVALELRKINNFNGEMEIVSGLNRTPIYRLSDTKRLLQHYKNFHEELDSSRSFAKLRQAIREANPPCIPYMGMYLTDLNFIEEGNKDYIPKTQLINFFKIRLISGKIKEIRTYQNQGYDFKEIPEIQQRMENQLIHDEKDLQELSLYHEPKEGAIRGPRPALLTGEKEKEKKKENPKVELDYSKNDWMAFRTPDSPSNLILNSYNSLSAATVPKIVERLTHLSSPDSGSIMPILAVLHRITTPKDFLNLLVMRFSVPPSLDKSEEAMMKFKQEVQTPISLRVYNVIKFWVTYFWHHFEEDQETKNAMMGFLKGPMTERPITSPSASKLLSMIDNFEKKKKVDVPEELVEVPKEATMLDFKPEDWAVELYVRFREHFEKISVSEFEGTPTPTLDKYGNFTLDFKKLINYELTLAVSNNTLSALLSHLVLIAKGCLELHNWEAFVALVSVLDQNNDPTFKIALMKIPEKDLWREYREHLSSKNEQKLLSIVNSLPTGSVPLLYLYKKAALAELQKVTNEPPADSSGLINLENKMAVGNIIVRIVKLQKDIEEKKMRSSVPAIHSFMASRQPKLDGVSLSESSEDPFRKSPPESIDTSSDGEDNTSPHSALPVLSQKQMNKAFRDLIATDMQFREEISNLIKEVVLEESNKLKAEFKILMSQNASNRDAVPQPKDEPNFSSPIGIGHVKDLKIKDILAKHFPGSQIVTWDYTGDIEGNPTNIETCKVDFIKKESNYYVLDIKDEVSLEDLSRVLRIGKHFHTLYPDISLGCVVICSRSSKPVVEVAESCKIRLLSLTKKE
uniref:Ras-GEF domain-containing protein n=1 Tax=Arcella intermedia TaxID=1963864 RepID=A0A6B2KX29_9EUKA